MSDLKQLSQLADELLGTQERILALEAQLAEAQKRAVHLAEHAIPELMEEFGLADFTTEEGTSIKVADSVHAHLSEANKDDAFDWLDENGFGGLIKRTVFVGFSKEDETRAKALAGTLDSEGYAVKTTRDVHAATLKAWVKRRLEEGEEVPMKLFGVHVRRVAKVEK
jgi:hypothetical protein